jgi:cytochrome b561
MNTMSSSPNPALPTRYTGVAIAMHWLMAVLIVGAFGVGTYMVGLKLSPTKLQLYSWHKWAGVTIFVLLWARLVWRLGHPAPALPSTMPVWQQQVAGALHVVLYLLMIAVPLSGWLMSSAKGFQTVWFGVLPIPDLLHKNEALGDFLKNVHLFLTWSLAALVAAHVGAALKHHVIDRDDVLARMLPFLRRTG